MSQSQALSFPQFAIEKTWVRDAVTVLLASGLICCFAPLAIRLPFTPVPIATQCHVMLLLGALLGGKRGALAVLAFLFEVAIGLPVLSSGRVGLMAFVGPTGGYLIGSIVGAYLTGTILEKVKERTAAKTFGALLAGNLAMYLFGYAHLASFIGASKAFLLGIAPFIAGDLLKSVFCVRILKSLRFFK